VSIIKLEFSENDVIAQKYLGEALVNMARHRESGEAVSYEQQVGSTECTTVLDVEGLEKVSRDGLNEAIENNTTSGYVQLPWDERIHSSGKTQNQDGSWMKRKKPKDMTKDQWLDYVADVEAELTTLMSIPVEPVVEAKQDVSMEKTAFDEEQFEKAMEVVSSDRGEVVETVEPSTVANDVETQQVDDAVAIPKPPVINQDDQPAPPPPPVTDVAPVGNTPDVVEDVKPMTFVQLVQRMSAKCNGDVAKSAKIKDAIKEKYDVEFAALVKRPDLIPQIGAFLDTVEV
jgi:hypothetical protein